MGTIDTRDSTAVKVSSKGWIVIPAHLRRRYGIESGQQIRVIDYGGVLSLVPATEDPIGAGRGLLAGETSLRRALLEDRRRELAREKA